MSLRKEMLGAAEKEAMSVPVLWLFIDEAQGKKNRKPIMRAAWFLLPLLFPPSFAVVSSPSINTGQRQWTYLTTTRNNIKKRETEIINSQAAAAHISSGNGVNLKKGHYSRENKIIIAFNFIR